jgi:hypothetical protein
MPSLFIATLRLWKHAGETGRRPVAAAAIVFAALATVAPIVMTLGLGTSHLLINGGIPTMPWWLFVASTLAFIAAIVMRHVVTADKLTTFVFGIPAVGGGLGVIGVYWYEIASHGYISYYGEKLADAVTALCLIGLALFVADVLSRYTPQLRQSRSRVVLVGLAAVLMAVAVFQINGYVGPRQQTVAAGQAAVGFQTYTQWMAQDTTLNPVADSFFDSVDATRTRIAQSGELPETWSYIDTEGLDPRMDWTDLWYPAVPRGRADRPARRSRSVGWAPHPRRLPVGCGDHPVSPLTGRRCGVEHFEAAERCPLRPPAVRTRGGEGRIGDEVGLLARIFDEQDRVAVVVAAGRERLVGVVRR